MVFDLQCDPMHVLYRWSTHVNERLALCLKRTCLQMVNLFNAVFLEVGWRRRIRGI